jgi:hypothetical protein
MDNRVRQALISVVESLHVHKPLAILDVLDMTASRVAPKKSSTRD